MVRLECMAFFDLCGPPCRLRVGLGLCRCQCASLLPFVEESQRGVLVRELEILVSIELTRSGLYLHVCDAKLVLQTNALPACAALRECAIFE